MCVCVSHLSLYQCQGLLPLCYQSLHSGRIADCPVGPEGITNSLHCIAPEAPTGRVTTGIEPETTSCEKTQKRARVRGGARGSSRPHLEMLHEYHVKQQTEGQKPADQLPVAVLPYAINLYKLKSFEFEYIIIDLKTQL